MSGVVDGMPDALRCPPSPSERVCRRALWHRWRRYPPGGRWGVVLGSLTVWGLVIAAIVAAFWSP